MPHYGTRVRIPSRFCVRGRSPSMEHRSKQSPCSLAHTKVCGDQDVSLADDPQNSSEQAVFICWILGAVQMIRCIFHVSVTRSAMCRRARMVRRRHLRAANRGGGPCANLQCISSYTQLVFARTPQPRSVLKSGAISRRMSVRRVCLPKLA